MDLNALRVFVKVADSLSFTKTASSMGLTQSGVSRSVARLEGELKVKLISRNTHSVSLTTDGKYLYETAKILIGGLEDLQHGLEGRSVLPEGKLKITMPSAFGRIVILPILKSMLDKYPALKIEASMTDRLIDLVEEGYDVAVRIGALNDSRLIARFIKHLKFVTVASKSYLHRYGRPSTPHDLSCHNCLAIKIPGAKGGKWRYKINDAERYFDVKGNMTVDTADALLEASICGLGLVQIMDFSAQPYIDKGELVEVMAEYAISDIPLSLIYARTRHKSPKINALMSAFGLE